MIRREIRKRLKHLHALDERTRRGRKFQKLLIRALREEKRRALMAAQVHPEK